MLSKLRKLITKYSLIYERRILVPYKIKFSLLETAIVSIDKYESNSHGYKSCVLFCHYNKYGLIIQQVRELCQFFQSSGIDVVFLTTMVLGESRTWLEENVSCLIVRKNIGRDFGAWKDGIRYLKTNSLYDNCSQLYLVNDSLVVMPENLKSEKIKRDFIDDIETDMIGLSVS